MAANPKILATYSFLDFSQEASVAQFHIDEGAETVNDILTGTTGTAAGDIYGVLTAMCYTGTVQSRGVTAVNRLSATIPSDADAQREKKWLISYFDTVTFAKFSLEIPCARLDQDAWFKPNTDELNLLITPVSTWVTALQGAMVSPDYNPITITNIRYVGRNT